MLQELLASPAWLHMYLVSGRNLTCLEPLLLQQLAIRTWAPHALDPAPPLAADAAMPPDLATAAAADVQLQSMLELREELVKYRSPRRPINDCTFLNIKAAVTKSPDPAGKLAAVKATLAADFSATARYELPWA